MTKKLLLNELLYIDEHLSCMNYLKEVEHGFKYIELKQDTHLLEECTSWNYLLMLIEGELRISSTPGKEQIYTSGDMVLIPKMSTLEGWGSKGVQLVSLSFDIPRGSCDIFALQSLSDICRTIHYERKPVRMRHPLHSYMDVLLHCLKNGMNCGHLHELMEKELFFLIRGFYAKEEIAYLFYPIIGQDLSFKKMIIENYRKVGSIDELVVSSNMCRSYFFIKFKQEFGMTAKQWIVKQQNLQIINAAMQPGISVKELMNTFMFDSRAHFTLYCKRHFGCTPKQLIIKYQAENQKTSTF